ncbi:MAG: 2-amino-4-hydroxy-6-hydroxymethyldihydropteridine diphosphokinase [Leptospiraceae bacterium]|nr:2-amino-4-hydroxy-6-hydroxymethyldihydropteridine diphosphokinase [Leptospiraceae bacterium]
MSELNSHKSLISIGSNLGDRLQYIQQSIIEVESIPTKIIAKSRILETKALEITDQPDFLNCILLIETNLSPLALLDQLQLIESKLRRIKRYDKGPREIDLDILTYDELVITNERLTLPHHSIETRPFIKELMAGLNPTLR